MSKDEETRAGGCSCGAIRFEATGEPRWVAHCHCTDCRRATASAMTTYAGYARTQVRFVAGEPASRHSSPGVTRRFCAACGTPISFEGERWPDEIHLFVCTFDDPAAFEPRAHVYTAEQVPWLHLDDGLRRFETTS
jgi:hypothetical protein